MWEHMNEKIFLRSAVIVTIGYLCKKYLTAAKFKTLVSLLIKCSMFRHNMDYTASMKSGMLENM